jgi:hypothetical protein
MVIESGFTFVQQPPPVSVPEPPMSVLFATMLGGLLLARLRRERRVRGTRS